jgi:hypothetical protein
MPRFRRIGVVLQGGNGAVRLPGQVCWHWCTMQRGKRINRLFTKVIEPDLTVSWLLRDEQNC